MRSSYRQCFGYPLCSPTECDCGPATFTGQLGESGLRPVGFIHNSSGYQLQFQCPPVNWKKSSIQPQQQVNFLGLHFKSITMEACFTPQRIDGLEKALSNFYKGKFVTVHRVQKLLRMLAAASMVIPLALLRTLNTGMVQLFSS